jgi:hypothetical protein
LSTSAKSPYRSLRNGTTCPSSRLTGQLVSRVINCLSSPFYGQTAFSDMLACARVSQQGQSFEYVASRILVRVLSEVAYGFCALAFLFFFYKGNSFCNPSLGVGLVLRLLRPVLAIVVWTAWQVSSGGRLTDGFARPRRGFGLLLSLQLSWSVAVWPTYLSGSFKVMDTIALSTPLGTSTVSLRKVMPSRFR